MSTSPPRRWRWSTSSSEDRNPIVTAAAAVGRRWRWSTSSSEDRNLEVRNTNAATRTVALEHQLQRGSQLFAVDRFPALPVWRWSTSFSEDRNNTANLARAVSLRGAGAPAPARIATRTSLSTAAVAECGAGAPAPARIATLLRACLLRDRSWWRWSTSSSEDRNQQRRVRDGGALPVALEHSSGEDCSESGLVAVGSIACRTFCPLACHKNDVWSLLLVDCIPSGAWYVELFGHSANRGGDRQLLEDHLRGVAVLARRFAGEFGVGDLGYLTGLWHDAGKASCAWQDGLVRAEASGGPVGVDHKTLGCELAAEHGLQALGLVLHGHHGGLTSPGFVADALKNLSEAQRRNNAEARRGLTDLLAETGWARDVVLPWAKPLVAEMGLRLVFSALCDADSLDTAMHREGLAAPLVARDADVGLLWDRFQQRREDLLRHRPMSAVNVARQALFDECLRAAGKPRGMFRIPAATGLGKTINAGAFAMRHAAIHGMRRVVVAVPWLTITEQNAAVYRGLLDEGDEQVVLEHHSGVDFDVLPDCRRWERLASENWDAPFVVTTTVRLFESLFGRKREATRRLHRLSNAVVVLDEVQGLPYRLLLPILDGLRTLVDHFGASVVLCSATQPDFWNLGPFQGMEACDIVVPQELTRAVDGRVRYEWWTDPQPMLSDVADRACADESALVVVNTTKDASAVVDRWRELAGDSLVYHLSTRMCPAHRRYVLAAVRSGLAAGTPVLLVSTQLIEAGVDVDFAVVYRALAPADSLVQAGGRANREGRLPDGGRVVIFDPLDGGAPPTYRTLVGNTRRFFGPDKSAPDDTTAQLRYWRAVYDDTGVEGRGSIGRQIQSARQRLDYQSVTDGPQDLETGARDSKLAFRMISDDSVAVICPQWVGNGDGRGTGEKNLVSNEFNPRVLELIDQVRSGIGIGSAMRQLQPFTTNLHISAVRKPGVTALLAPLLGDVDTPGSLAVWQGDYDVTTGIALDPEMERFVL